MSRGWTPVRLASVASLDALTATPADLSDDDLYIGLENIGPNGELIGLGDVRATSLRSNKNRFTSNDVLFGKLRPYLTKVARPTGAGVCSTDILVLRPSDALDRDYLYWWLRSPTVIADATARSTGATLPRISPSTLGEFEIPVPSIAEQQRIVAKLDELSEIHAKLATCYASAVEQTKAIWVSALNHELEPKDSWTPVTLGDVATFHNGRAYKKEELLASGKYRVLRVGNFFSSDSWYWSDLELDPTKYCVHGDLLYAWSASFGPRIWDGDKTIYHYHIWKVVEDSSLIGRMFLKFWLEADVERVKAASGTGTTMMHVSKGSIEAREIRVPPLSLQRAIVEKLEEVQKGLSLLVDVHSKRLEAAQNLRRSVLAAAFRGDL